MQYFKAGAKPQTISASHKPNKCSADGKDSGKSKKQSEREEGKRGEEKSGVDGAGEKGREVEGEGEKGREDDGKMEMEGEVVEDRQGVKDVEKNEETEKAKEKEKEEEEESGNRKRKRGTVSAVHKSTFLAPGFGLKCTTLAQYIRTCCLS